MRFRRATLVGYREISRSRKSIHGFPRRGRHAALCELTLDATNLQPLGIHRMVVAGTFFPQTAILHGSERWPGRRPEYMKGA